MAGKIGPDHMVSHGMSLLFTGPCGLKDVKGQAV
jgi:hypothetical protein